MKYLSSQLGFLLAGESRANLSALLKYFAFLVMLITAYAVLFHLIMGRIEGQQHSWITGFYWTLVVMTTLGFGDITFTSDVGRLFSIVVLLSGVVFLLVMLPFLFIRLFYAPWLEARVRLRAPRDVRPGTAGHVIITEYDAVAIGLVERLRAAAIPYFIVEPDAATAARLVGDDLSVVTGERDSRATYERLLTPSARLVVANCEDTANTNITLTVREVAPQVHIAAVVEEEDSIDILQLSGATTVLPLKRQLGESLANRVDAGRAEAHVIGSFRSLQIAELPVHNTPLAGLLVRETRLRERTGLSVVGIWERGRLQPAFPDTEIRANSVAVVAGTAPQIAALSALLARDGTTAPVLVIGAGKVGQAAARALKRKALVVYALDRDAKALETLAPDVDAVYVGDAADRELIERAGIHGVASVLLTTNDDAMNIYLAVYCRRLNANLRIVSRITHERNVEAIHRAGADFVLSYTSLGVESIMSLVNGDAAVTLGEGVRLFEVRVPSSLAGQPLSKTGIGSRTGLSVVAMEDQETLTTQLTAETVLPRGGKLLMLGSAGQHQRFVEAFDVTRR
ncbi:MAG: potassium transporter TrkA [Acidobacteria bacterium]|nr:MAG: potassium transporter TrkA [Acidobacteriota bacterium]